MKVCSIVGFLMTAGGAAHAAVIRVPEDHPRIYEAIDAASEGDSVLVAPGLWTDRDSRLIPVGGDPRLMTACGFLKRGVAVIGTGGPDATIVDAGEVGPGFVSAFIFANSSGMATLQGFTIHGAGVNAHAVIALDTQGLIIKDCNVSGNDLPGTGSAIYLNPGDLVIEDSKVSFNVVDDGPASGIFLDGRNLTIRRCRFEGNVGLPVTAGPTFPGGGSALIEDSIFIGNSATGAAPSAVDLGAHSTAVVQRCQFIANRSFDSVGGHRTGALYVAYPGSATIAFNTFAFDSAMGLANYPAGLYVICIGPVDIRSNTFYRCFTEGASFSGGSAATIGGLPTEFHQNVIAGSGGEAGIHIPWDMNQAPFNHSCNVFWNNENGDYHYSAGEDPPPDIVEDPQLCDPEVLDFTVAASSPCAPENSPGCGLIGAWPVGCGSISVEGMSWGRIKELYR